MAEQSPTHIIFRRPFISPDAEEIDALLAEFRATTMARLPRGGMAFLIRPESLGLAVVTKGDIEQTKGSASARSEIRNASPLRIADHIADKLPATTCKPKYVTCAGHILQRLNDDTHQWTSSFVDVLDIRASESKAKAKGTSGVAPKVPNERWIARAALREFAGLPPKNGRLPSKQAVTWLRFPHHYPEGLGEKLQEISDKFFPDTRVVKCGPVEPVSLPTDMPPYEQLRG
jgi:hypothetical protein